MTETKTKPAAAKPTVTAKTPAAKAATSPKPASSKSTTAKLPVARPAAKATTATKTGTASKSPAKKKSVGPKIAVFIDIENTGASRDNLLEVFTGLNLRGNVVYGKLYGYEPGTGIDDIVKDYRLETVGRVHKAGNDSVVDTRLVIDCMVAAGNRTKQEYIFVWAGVGDLSSLFAQIKQLKCKTFTLEIPGFEIDSKLVDQKMRLFSPVIRSAPVAKAPPSTSAPYSAATAPAPMIGSVAPMTVPTKQSMNVIAEDIDGDLDLTDTFNEDDFIFNDSELEGLEDLNDIYDDEEDYDDDLDDFDDLGDDDQAAEPSNATVNTEPMDAFENERLLAITTQMLRDMRKSKKGKPAALDAKKIAKDLGLDDDTLGIPPITEEERKSIYGSAGFEYGADDGNEAPDDREKTETEEPDEYGSFGKI